MSHPCIAYRCRKDQPDGGAYCDYHREVVDKLTVRKAPWLTV